MNTTAALYAHPTLSHRSRAYFTITFISIVLGLFFALIIPELKTEKIPLLFLYFSPMLIPLIYFLNQAKTHYHMLDTGITRKSLFRSKHVSWEEVGEVQFSTEGKNDQYVRKSSLTVGSLIGLISELIVLVASLVSGREPKAKNKVKTNDQVTKARILDRHGSTLMNVPQYLTPDFAKLVTSRAKNKGIAVFEW